MTLEAEVEVLAEEPLRSAIFRTLGEREPDYRRLDAFLSAEDEAAALSLWFGPEVAATTSLDRLRRLADRDIAEIDAALNRFANSVLHHPRFQALESAWRSVLWLVNTLGADMMTGVRVLDARWSELARDLERAPEFDQSFLFDQIYNQEFGMPGGVPFSMMVGLYEVQHRPSRNHPTDDVTVMRHLSAVAAAAFCPIVMGVAPAMFGVDSFVDLDVRQSLAPTFRLPEYNRFQSFQQTPDSRFIGLVAPRILLRRAYRHRAAGDCGFRFEEDVSGTGEADQLWAPGAVGLANICLRAFNENRWLAAIRGTVQDQVTAGVMAGLPIADFETDAPETALRSSIEVNVSETLEREMADAGFIPIRRCKDTPHVAIYSMPTVHKPRGAYFSEIARVNEQLGSMLNYILCVARFAHYIKIIARNWIGSYKTAEECEKRLQRWLNGFCSGGDQLSYEMKARYPLQEGRIRVRDVPAKPGSYECTVALKPHFQLDQAVSEFQLVTMVEGVERQL
jgi:type VI secretion system protein ImpD